MSLGHLEHGMVKDGAAGKEAYAPGPG